MVLTFISNFFNHHQKPICDILYQKLGSNFTFISTMPMPESFSKSGYEDYSKVSYNLLSYVGQKEYAEAKRLGMESDLVIFGTAPLEFVIDRIKSNKYTFRYAERFYKKGNYQKFDYRIIFHLLKYHTRFRSKNVYMLCASAFTANDFTWVGAYPNKLLKWGYFPKVEEINMKGILKGREGKKIKLLFVGRLVKFKHPELVIRMAKILKYRDISFEVDIIGSGPLLESLKSDVESNDLTKNVIFVGNLPNSEVIHRMRASHIFLFTSDRGEGWGAVLNEAMGSGCSIVASHVIGSAPFLLKHGINGLIFKSGDVNDLANKVEQLILDKNLRNKIAFNAYKTVKNTWSPENAANNLLLLYKSFFSTEKVQITHGPCSVAKSTPQNWFKK